MTLEQQTARCWAEVDLDLIRHNFRTAREQCPGVTVIPVIKADAYGLGAARVAPALWQAGADVLAVAEYTEALEVQSVCPAQVLVMGYTHPAFYADAVEK